MVNHSHVTTDLAGVFQTGIYVKPDDRYKHELFFFFKPIVTFNWSVSFPLNIGYEMMVFCLCALFLELCISGRSGQRSH